MAVTLRTIAEECGVSIATASEILGAKAHLYGAKTRALVRTTAERLGYRPNVSARATQSGRFNCVALFQDTNHYRSDFQADLVDGIQNSLAACGQQMALMEVPDAELMSRGIQPRILEADSVDAMIINYHADTPEPLERLIRNGRVPAIWVNSKRDEDCVRPDDSGGMRRLVEALVSRGHRRIAYLDPGHAGMSVVSRHYSRDDRRLAYVEAVAAAGIAPSFPGEGRDAGYAEIVCSVRDALAAADRPSAIILAGTSFVTAAVEAAAAAGLRVPGDLAIAVVASALGKLWALPPMHVMLVPWYRIGCEATRLAMLRINGERSVEPVVVRCPVFGPGETARVAREAAAYQAACRERRLEWIRPRWPTWGAGAPGSAGLETHWGRP